MQPPGRSHSSSSQGRAASFSPLQLVAVIAASGSVWLLRCIFKRLSLSGGKKGERAPAAESAPIAPQTDALQEAEQEEEEVEPEELMDPDTFEVLVSELLISPPPLPIPGSPESFNPAALSRPLKELRFVVSEECSVEGFAPTLGTPLPTPTSTSTDAPSTSDASPPGADSEAVGSDIQVIAVQQPQHTSAPAVSRLLAAGATCIGRSGLQLGNLVGANFGNPFNKGHISGGGCTGAAAAVACGVAHFALATDFLGEAMVPAAYCGLYCYRGTLGMVASSSSSSSSSLRREGQGLSGAVSLMASDPAVLMKAAQALGSPGDPNIKGELMKFVVAEDLFNLCNIEFQPASLAVKRAILKWAGSDQAGAVQLVKFLADNSGAWQQLDVSPTPHPMMPRGLDAFRTAALLLRAEELRTRAQLLGYISPPVPKPTPTAAATPPTAAVPAASASEAAQTAAAAAAAAPEPAAETEAAAAVEAREPATAGAVDAVASKESAVVESAPSDESPVAGATPSAVEDQSAAVDAEAGADLAPSSSTTQQETEGAAGAATGAEDISPASASEDTEPTPAAATAAEGVEAVASTDGAEGSAADRSVAAVESPQGSRAEPSAAQDGVAGAVEGGEGVAAEEEGAEAAVAEFATGGEPDWLPEEPDAAQLAVARTIAKQLLDTLRTTVKPDTFMVIPIVPCAAFKRGVGPQGQQQFNALAQALSCLPALAQCPSVVVPLGTVADGTPLSVAIFGVHNRQQQQNVAPRKAAATQQQPQVDAKRAERAEKFKTKGTEFFKVKQFAKAFDEYTRAINENPHSYIYYNNRAMACLKIFRFEQAEDDCCKVLTFELDEDNRVKALLRRATARTALQKYTEAESDLRAVILLQPQHRQARDEITNLRIMKQDLAAAEQRAAVEYRNAAMQQQQQQAGGRPGRRSGGVHGSIRAHGGDGQRP
ncbi:MAG: hypothetical protein WDW36_001714 [Sanguina aurantia]